MAKIEAYIIDTDQAARLKLMKAATELPVFSDIHLYDNFDNAALDLTSDKRCDIAFISSKFPPSDCMGFVSRAREMMNGRDTTFVLIVGSVDETKLISRSLMGGISGFLVEPYSLDALTEIIDISARVKAQRGIERQQLAYTMLAKEIFGGLSIVNTLRVAGMEPSASVQALKDSCAVLQTFNPDELKAFYFIVSDILENSAHEKLLPDDFRYDGTSKRVKQRLEKEMLNLLKRRLRKETESLMQSVVAGPTDNAAPS